MDTRIYMLSPENNYHKKIKDSLDWDRAIAYVDSYNDMNKEFICWGIFINEDRIAKAKSK